MYKNILFCLDNSDCSTRGIDLGVTIAASCGARLTGCHVYAARLHNMRFQQMEAGLPPRYQNEEELERQRDIHDSLITKGLRLISDSYAGVLKSRAAQSGLEARSLSRDGKNFSELVAEASEGGYDLVVIGAHGLGRTGRSRVGSVCERVVRRVSTDILVSRDSSDADGAVLAAIDGSPASFGALLKAIELGAVFNRPVEAISVFDPDYHYKAFRSIAGVLTEEAGSLFRFKEQERLHEEVIDSGLARIYRAHLDTAGRVAAERGCRITTRLLSGKPFEEIVKHAGSTGACLLVMGKTGFHAAPSLDIGSTTENCLREAPCGLLISRAEFTPVPAATFGAVETLSWTEEALAILEKVPQFARGIVKNMVEDAAKREGYGEITHQLMAKVRRKMDES